MCGITGVYCFNESGKLWLKKLEAATEAMQLRGPDAGNTYIFRNIGIGHRRLSIIDTSAAAHQPFFSADKKFAIIFNGEIFNYRELRNNLIAEGEQFRTTSDTEVVLRLYQLKGKNFLNELNGFFAFAIADLDKQSLFIARDRFGVKPLLYSVNDSVFAFASEMKAMMHLPIEKKLDTTSLVQYFQFNYIVAPRTIFTSVRKLLPGHCISISNNKAEIQQWYTIPYDEKEVKANPISFENAQNKFLKLFEDSVQRRMISDVPLGAFLSGGIDSSAVVAMASKHTAKLNTFSIGFKDEPLFDETHYAELVAKKFNTNHQVFSLTNDDMYDHLGDVLDYIDEPFADSSALPVYILSKHTRKHVTVSLSGDGADELFGGYLKHVGEYRTRNAGALEKFIGGLHPVLKNLPQSRNTKTGNLFRQMNKFSEGMVMTSKDRYLRYASFISTDASMQLLNKKMMLNIEEIKSDSEQITRFITDQKSMNDVFLSDMNGVLPNDMLTKVDLMSMANSLEVRTPFLDFELVNFAFTLPSDYKVKGNYRKRIVQEAFKNILPMQLYHRPKRGFEIPLLQWFRTGLKSLIEDDLLSDAFIEEQQIFNSEEIKKIKHKLFSNNPEDVHAQLWALLVFQSWWKKYMKN